jgi:hypothetical protein
MKSSTYLSLGFGIALSCATAHANAESVLASYVLNVFNNVGDPATDLSGLDLKMHVIQYDVSDTFASSFAYALRFSNDTTSENDITSGAAIRKIYLENGLSEFIALSDDSILGSMDPTDDVDFVKDDGAPPGGQNEDLLDPTWSANATMFAAKKDSSKHRAIGSDEYLDIGFTLLDGVTIADVIGDGGIGVIDPLPANRVAVHVIGFEGEPGSFSAVIEIPMNQTPTPSPTAAFAGLIGIAGLACRRRPKAPLSDAAEPSAC